MIPKIVNKIKAYLFHFSCFICYGLISKGHQKWGFIVKKPLMITPRYICWEKGVYVQANSRIEGVSQYGEDYFEPMIVFGKRVSIQQNAHITCANKIVIGENTAIAANVTITDINHEYTDPYVPVEEQPITTQPVMIGKDSKVYNNSVILPGSVIGDHCVVGANSVVSGCIPDFSVAVGAPARVIKQFNFELQKWVSVGK